MKIRFIGAVGTVTGSCTLLEHNKEFFLIDCGAGRDAVANASTPLDFKPHVLRSMFLTHAHLDHCGLIPALIAKGFHGRIYCTRATRDLTLNALQDAVTLGNCEPRHVPKLEQFECPDEHPEFAWGKYIGAAEDLTVAFSRTSHILGAVSVSFQHKNLVTKEHTTICFSGDLGCNDEGNCFQSLLARRYQPDFYPSFLVLESTYGARNRPTESSNYEARMNALTEMLTRALSLSASPLILIPCFTLHRTQELMADFYCLLNTHLTSDIKTDWASRLNQNESEEPLLDIAIESTLAWKHTNVYRNELTRILNTNKRKFLYLNGEFPKRAGVSEESIPSFLETLFAEPNGAMIRHGAIRIGKDTKYLSKRSIRIVIAGSGMCQGGRILEHLKTGLADAGVLVVLTGFQAPDTLGGQLRLRVENPSAPLELKEWLPANDVQATITDLGSFYSGHADQAGLVKYALNKDQPRYYKPLRRIFLNHGEQSSREILKEALLAYSVNQADKSRELAAVELPNPNAGWFDLSKNAWTDDVELEVDGLEGVVLTLYRKVQRLESELVELKSKKG